MKRIKKEFEHLDIKVAGFPIAVEKTLPLHPSFNRLWDAFPQIHRFFEDVPKAKKRVDADS